MSSIDFIGDIHGRGDELEALLIKLGYQKSGASYRHTQRSAVFLGDLIDRGEQNRATINIVRSMVDAGHAQVIMGNHEYNAICYHSNHPKTGLPLREHTAKNTKQHNAFLVEFGDEATRTEVINWFRQLPLYLETETYRAIHASWHSSKINRLKVSLKEGIMTDDFLLQSSAKGSPEHLLVEDLLKGPELSLPDGKFFIDKDGHKRLQVRTRWWHKQACTYRDAAMVDQETLQKIPERSFPTSNSLYGYPEEAVPVFFGHYWLTGRPIPQRDNIACLDYSVAKPEGRLCAYRYEGEKKLCASRFVTVDRRD
jgi:hypothetical protein